MELNAEIEDTVEDMVSSGREVGVQVVVVHDGMWVTEVNAGTRDALGTLVTWPTLFFAASAGKAVLSSLVHVLVANGELEYDMPIVEVWPEFGAHGKGDVTVRHALLHQAGVPGLPADLTVPQLCDWQYMCGVIADATPWWPAGSAMGYHALTFGFLLGETLQRATGEALPELLRRALTGPADVADDVHFGVPHMMLKRVTHQFTPDEAPPLPDPESPAAKAVPPRVRADARFANRRDVRTAHIPSMGTMTAGGAANLFAALLDGTLLPRDRLQEAAAPAFEGDDVVMGMHVSFGLGYAVERPGPRKSRPGSTFGMMGANGSAVYADIDTGIAVAVLRNKFNPSFDLITAVDDLVTQVFPPPDW